MARVAICSPHAGKTDPRWERSMLEMQIANPQHNFTRIEVDMMIVGKARNMLIEMALGIAEGFDVIWFIDDDVLLTKEAAVLIDQAISLGVVSGVYYSRRMPYTPQAYDIAREPEYAARYYVYWPKISVEEVEAGLRKVDSVGGGCLAIAVPVLVRLQDHWRKVFKEASELHEDPMLKYIIANLSPWFEFLDRKGEDMYFCERCMGIKQDIWLNGDVQCGHIGEVIIEQQHFKYLVDNKLLTKVNMEAKE